MRTLNEVLISNGDASGPLVSKTLTLEQALGYMVQAIISGAPVGSLSLYGSADAGIDTVGTGVTNWQQVGGSIAPVTGAGTVVWNCTGFAYYKWLRVVYTPTSGSGSITVTANTKG